MKNFRCDRYGEGNVCKHLSGERCKMQRKPEHGGNCSSYIDPDPPPQPLMPPHTFCLNAFLNSVNETICKLDGQVKQQNACSICDNFYIEGMGPRAKKGLVRGDAAYQDYHCPTCGELLRPVVELDEDWYDFCESNFSRYEWGPSYLLCTNKNCIYNDCPLTVFHPVQGPNHAPGDSWAIGYIK